MWNQVKCVIIFLGETGQKLDISCGGVRKYAIRRADVPSYCADLLSRLLAGDTTFQTCRTYGVELFSHSSDVNIHGDAHTSRAYGRPWRQNRIANIWLSCRPWHAVASI